MSDATTSGGAEPAAITTTAPATPTRNATIDADSPAAQRNASAEQDRSSGRLATRGDPMALSLYRLLERRPAGDLEYVLETVIARDTMSGLDITTVAPPREVRGDRAARVAVCKSSMLAAAEKLGRFPSRREYDRWRDSQPRPDEFAASTFIRRTFNNSWTEALGQLGAPTVEYTARRLLSNGTAFTAEEIERALQLFAADVPAGQRTCHKYTVWARGYVRQEGAFDVPITATTLTKRTGKRWFELLDGLGENEDRFRPHSATHGIRRCRPLTRDEMLDRIRQASKELRIAVPSTTEYNRWASTTFDEHDRRIAPTSGTVMTHFGGWSRALFQAGLISREQLALYWQRHEMRMSDERALEFLAAALRDRGPEVARGRGGYRQWRAAVLRHPDWAGTARLPADDLIWGRFDRDWAEAVKHAASVAPAEEVPPHLHTHQIPPRRKRPRLR